MVKATPRLKVREVLPTPPFPEAIAMNRDIITITFYQNLYGIKI
jgi:hypothetical protein